MLDENEEYFSDGFDAVGYYMDRMREVEYDED